MRARIAPLCLVLLVMGLASAGADVFSQVPADAVLVVTAPSPDALTDGFGGFSDGFLPGSSQKIDSTIGLMLTSQTGVKDGLDMAGPVAMAVMLAPPAEEAVVAEAPTEEEGVSVEASAQVAKPSFATIMIVSLSDEAAWREAMGENITSDEGDQYEHILGDFGPAAYFTVKDGFLVTAESADHLALWAEAISTPMGEARGKKLAGGLARSTVSAHLSITTLKRLYPQWSALLDGVSPQTGNEMTDAVFDAYLDMAREIADGVDGVLLEAVASKKGLRLGATLEVAEGSLFQEFFSSQSLWTPPCSHSSRRAASLLAPEGLPSSRWPTFSPTLARVCSGQ